MAAVHIAPKVLRFDDYEIDLSSGRLCKGGSNIHLRDKSFQVLACLVERPGAVVTRDELRRHLWPDDVFVDFDNNLNAAVARLREALGESAARPRFIETLPRYGYRFIAEVFEAPALPEPPRRRRTRLLVLPFVNLSGERAQELLGDTVTDELITELVRLAPDELAVIARTTAMHYKRSQKDVARIGRELGVDFIVEGSIRRQDDEVNLNVQLIRVGDQTHVWAQRYAVPLGEIGAAERAVALTVARETGVTAGPAGASAPGAAGTNRKALTGDLVAYSEFLKGRQAVGFLTEASLSKARRHFEAAVGRDPTFALAYDSLAEACWWLGYMGFMRPSEAFSAAVLHGVRALEIDNTLGEAHALVAQFHKQLDYNWPEVERGMTRALELDPGSALVRVRRAWNLLMPLGRLEEAAREIDLALDVDPLSTYYRTSLAIVFVLWRKFDRAIEEGQKLLALDPNAYLAWLAISASSSYQGRLADAIDAQQKAVEVSDGASSMLGWLGLFLGAAGRHADARGILRRLHERARGTYVPATSIAWIHLGLGELDDAFDWLDRAVDERDQFMMPIRSYGFFDPIRSHPRFLALLRKMRLDG